MAIKLFWQGGDRGEINFGDTLSPVIVEMLSRKKTVFSDLYHCDLIAIGSLLDKAVRRQWKRIATLNWGKTHVWGTGSFGTDTISRHKFLTVAAVRGPMTRALMGLPEDLPLGDPGLFVNQLVKPARTKTHRWGIVPHVTDRTLPIVAEMQKQTTNACIIDLANPDLQETIANINRCEFVVSSSLHGLIAADALGVPNAWMRISNNVNGGDWKFHDYFLSVDRPAVAPISPLADLQRHEDGISCAAASIISRRQQELETAFKKTGL